MFASIYRRYKTELRADFQQYYTLNIDKMGTEYSIMHAADLSVMLPQNSRVMCRIDPANAWGWQEHLLADLANRTRWLQWAKTTDGAKNRNHPIPIEPPKREVKKVPQNPVHRVTEYARRLGLPRKTKDERGIVKEKVVEKGVLGSHKRLNKGRQIKE